MAGKIKTSYVCSECGYSAPKWSGQCPGCRAWNTLNEEIVQQVKSAVASVVKTSTFASVKSVTQIEKGDEHRYLTGIGEFDRVLGGGLV